jgi:glutarate dioxygenase
MSLAMAPVAHDPLTREERRGRMVHIRPTASAVQTFLQRVEAITIDDLKRIPYKRYICAREMLAAFGDDFGDRLRAVLDDYETGCLALHFGELGNQQDCVLIATAVSHLLSKPIPEPSGGYFGITTVVHDDAPSLKILDPYRYFSLHTDGVFADNPVDWLMMMKLEEQNAIGGESRLLHMADFDAFEPLCRLDGSNTIFSFGLDEKDRRYEIFSKVSGMERGRSRILDTVGGQRRIKFVDQFILPETIAEATFIERVHAALEACQAIVVEPLPVGSMLILNNSVWVHGRAPFKRNPGLQRSLLRQYGYFPHRHPYMR